VYMCEAAAEAGGLIVTASHKGHDHQALQEQHAWMDGRATVDDEWDGRRRRRRTEAYLVVTPVVGGRGAAVAVW
jgi:hypothetical protein